MKKIYLTLLTMVFLFSCTKDEQRIETEESTTTTDFISRVNQGEFDNTKLGLYKGIFTTNDASTRATVRIENNGKDIPVAILTTSEGETFKLSASQKMRKGKASDQITFASTDASFDFSVDENGENITVQNVKFKGSDGDIRMAKQTSKAPVETVTGTYTCVDCSGHPDLGEQPETQTFNFMFNGTGENATVETQVTLKNRVYASEGASGDVSAGNGLTQTNCVEDGVFTTCDLVSGDGSEDSIALFGDSGPVYITAVHTYNNQEAGTDCSSISGTMTYESSIFGTSILSIQSDEAINCEVPGPQVLIFEDFEDYDVEYVQTRRTNDEVISDDLSTLAQNRYYGILIGEDRPNNVSYTGHLGDGFYGAQNINSAGTPVNRVRLTYSGIDISSYSLLDFSLFFATDDENADGDWDQTARAGVEYSFDGGETWNKVLAVEAGPADPADDQENDFVYEDVDFDGIGDVAGARITNAFTQLERQLETQGNSSIDIRIYIRVLNNDQEDIALDNFLVTAQ